MKTYCYAEVEDGYYYFTLNSRSTLHSCEKIDRMLSLEKCMVYEVDSKVDGRESPYSSGHITIGHDNKIKKGILILVPRNYKRVITSEPEI